MTPCKAGNPDNCGKDVKHHRYQVWCVSPTGERELIGWVADKSNIEFVDTEAEAPKKDPNEVWGKTKPIGGEE